MQNRRQSLKRLQVIGGVSLLFVVGGLCLAAPPTRAEAEAALMDATGVSRLSETRYKVGSVQFDTKARTVTIPATVNMREQVVEYALVSEDGKTHESVFVTEAKPIDVHLACLMLGVRATNVIDVLDEVLLIPPANAVDIHVKWRRNGPNANFPIAQMVTTRKSIGSEAWHNPPDDPESIGEATVMTKRSWLYEGSSFQAKGFMAQVDGSIIATIADPMALIVNPGVDRSRRDVQHHPNKRLLPPEGRIVEVVLSFSDLSDQSDQPKQEEARTP